MMDFEGFIWAHSADRHGIPREDAVCAIVNARIFGPNFDHGRIGGKGWAHLWIGPTRDGRLHLEVIAHFNQAARIAEVFHVMPLRKKMYGRAVGIVKERTGQWAPNDRAGD